MSNDAKKYTKRVYEALATAMPWVYEGRQGALRLAREYGAALADSPDDEAREQMKNSVSYNEICVKGYDLKPPISVKEWQDEVKRSYEKTRNGGTADGEDIT